MKHLIFGMLAFICMLGATAAQARFMKYERIIASIEAYDHAGNEAKLSMEQSTKGQGVGVLGGRYPEIDFDAQKGTSERLEVTLHAPVQHLEVMLSMFFGNEHDGNAEQAHWRALDAQKKEIARGIFTSQAEAYSPDASGIQRFEIHTEKPFTVLEFTAGGYQAKPGEKADSSDYLLYGLKKLERN